MLRHLDNRSRVLLLLYFVVALVCLGFFIADGGVESALVPGILLANMGFFLTRYLWSRDKRC